MKPYTLILTKLKPKATRRTAEEAAKHHLFGNQLWHDRTGRPFLSTDQHLDISLSHSLNWLAALLVPRGTPAGIDIEEKGQQAERVIERVSTAEERDLLKADGLSPLHLWTAKEALYKAFSHRLSKGVAQISFKGVDRFELHCDDGIVEHQLVEWIEWQGALIAHNIPFIHLDVFLR